MEVTPALVLSMWAAGLAGGIVMVVGWRVVGPGYTWLAGGATLLFGVPAAVTAAVPLGWVGVGAAVLVVAASRRPAVAVVAGAATALAFLLVAAGEGDPVPAASGALFLGAVTSEMVLGHWYLVDPRLPRWALRRLALAGCGAAALDVAVLAASGVFPWVAGDWPIGAGFLLLASSSAVLMLAVVAALREQGYSGVMAATGLSYLALLTSIGAVVLGRLLVAGPVLS